VAPVRPIIDPPAARLDEFAGTDRRGMADDGDQIALAACLQPQDAEPTVLVVKGDALDEAGEVLAFGRGLRRLHPRITFPLPRAPGADSSSGARFSQGLVEQLPWHVQQSKASLVRKVSDLGAPRRRSPRSCRRKIPRLSELVPESGFVVHPRRWRIG
jgi:hypothetical protein